VQHIPKVDLSHFLSSDPKLKTKFVTEMGAAFEEIGFVSLKGHFLSSKLMNDLYLEIKNFFDLGLEQKKSYEIKGGGGQRGYTSFGKEHAKDKKEGDLKEFWHFGQYEESPLKKYPENITVNELPKFNELGKETYKLLEKTALHVLRAIALHLDLKEQYFDTYTSNGNSILRAIHYPPILEEPKEAVRAAAHGDINLITLLMGAQGKGLQVMTNQGKWIDAIAEPDELIINMGDMMSRLTNNKLKSTLHRVVNPPRSSWGSSRYSIPFFMHPEAEMSLNCLPNCFSDENPKKYEDTTAGSFLNQRLIELGLLKK
jgi:isopenicillin N synthase-like dioxygenase|tara:strand:- start:1776 stop:2717 length:942 start_codon:yes stop_codon:yes gene_type:complete